MKRTLKIAGGILAASLLLTIIWTFAYPRLFPQRMLANQTKYQMVFLAAAASESYRLHSSWPASFQELFARPDPGGNVAMILKTGTNDAWERPFVFEPYDPVRGYGRIISYGTDGLPENQAAADDIVLNYGEDQKITFAERR